MIPMKYWIKKIDSVEKCTELFQQMKNRKPKQPVVKATMQVNCFGIESTETRYFYLDEWNNIRRVGYFVG